MMILNSTQVSISPSLKAMSEEHVQTREIVFLHQNDEDALTGNLAPRNCKQGLQSVISR